MQVETNPTRATAATLEHYDKGYEVVDGELVRKASPSFEHGDAQGALYGILLPWRGRDGKPGGWWLGIEVEVELAIDQVYLPDVAGWRIERVPERPRGRPVRTRPDWVAEVLSPSTKDRDLGPKLHSYHRARVGHYWVIHPDEQELRVLRWREDGYELVFTASAIGLVRAEPFDAIELDLGALFSH